MYNLIIRHWRCIMCHSGLNRKNSFLNAHGYRPCRSLEVLTNFAVLSVNVFLSKNLLKTLELYEKSLSKLQFVHSKRKVSTKLFYRGK